MDNSITGQKIKIILRLQEENEKVKEILNKYGKDLIWFLYDKYHKQNKAELIRTLEILNQHDLVTEYWGLAENTAWTKFVALRLFESVIIVSLYIWERADKKIKREFISLNLKIKTKNKEIILKGINEIISNLEEQIKRYEDCSNNLKSDTDLESGFIAETCGDFESNLDNKSFLDFLLTIKKQIE